MSLSKLTHAFTIRASQLCCVAQARCEATFPSTPALRPRKPAFLNITGGKGCITPAPMPPHIRQVAGPALQCSHPRGPITMPPSPGPVLLCCPGKVQGVAFLIAAAGEGWGQLSLSATAGKRWGQLSSTHSIWARPCHHRQLSHTAQVRSRASSPTADKVWGRLCTVLGHQHGSGSSTYHG